MVSQVVADGAGADDAGADGAGADGAGADGVGADGAGRRRWPTALVPTALAKALAKATGPCAPCHPIFVRPIFSSTHSRHNSDVIKVLYFAAAAEGTGCPQEQVELDGVSISVRSLRLLLIERHPALGRVLPRSRLAVNLCFASDDDFVADGSEVAVIPPVGGG